MAVPYDAPTVRPLRVYAFDPTRGRNVTNIMTIDVEHEALAPGPIGRHLAVVDYDASNQCFYEAVDLDDPNVLIANGLPPSETDPRFHQQMVYAVASETIRRFERALGRPVQWRTDTGRKADPYHKLLRIFPHALQEANAFYDPALRALVFGYFKASETDAGANLPGQVIFTCLSHDIVAHETTHALVDGLREHFSELTSIDTPAFHEAFADIVALFQHFSMKEPVLETIRRTGGLIHKTQLAPEVAAGAEGPTTVFELTEDNPLVELARQFGEAMGMRTALRQALGTKPNTHDLTRFTEPHARGSILVAAVFDAYFTIYLRRTRDLMRIARAGGVNTTAGDLHPDLAQRLANEAIKTAENFSTLCIRALDYCPPVDIQFGEFLRAVITADMDMVPEDDWGYRAALIEAFRLRGIVPENVESFSEEALCWRAPEFTRGERPRCEGLTFDVMARQDDRERLERQVRALHKFASTHARVFGLNPKRPIEIDHPLRYIHRVAPDGRIMFEFSVEFLQHREVPLFPDAPELGSFKFRGGATVLFDQQGCVRYAVIKRVESEHRLQRQREYLQMGGAMGAGAYRAAVKSAAGRFADTRESPFSAIHRGY
jgi:hypothetical protein